MTKAQVIELGKGNSGEQTLDKEIFGLEVRNDILYRVVNWQLAKRQAGTRKTKTISEISGTTAKPFRQKGTGNARRGSNRATQMRGGATMFGPVVRSHAHDLPKKIRKLGLKTALSSKCQEGTLVVLKDSKLKEPKTAKLAKDLAFFKGETVLVIDSNEGDENFKKAASNIAWLNVLPAKGANVYDILKSKHLVVTEAALAQLKERLSNG